MPWVPSEFLKPAPGYWGLLLNPRLRIGIVERAEHAPIKTHYTMFTSTLDVQEYLIGVFENAFTKLRESGQQAVFSDEEFAREYPTLYIFLSATEDDQGKPRTVSTLMVFIEGGMAKAMLKERDHDASLWVSSSSILGVFAAMEGALCKQPIDWRKSGAYKPRR